MTRVYSLNNVEYKCDTFLTRFHDDNEQHFQTGMDTFLAYLKGFNSFFSGCLNQKAQDEEKAKHPNNNHNVPMRMVDGSKES